MVKAVLPAMKARNEGSEARLAWNVPGAFFAVISTLPSGSINVTLCSSAW